LRALTLLRPLRFANACKCQGRAGDPRGWLTPPP